MRRTNCFAVVAVVMVLVCGSIGCSGKSVDAAPTADITFKVTVNGKPLAGPGINVVFQPIGKGAVHSLPLAADGSGKGKAVIGANSVRLVIVPSANAPAEPPGPDGAHGGGKGKGIGAQFFGELSTLTADVKNGAAFTFEAGITAEKSASGVAPSPAAHQGQ